MKSVFSILKSLTDKRSQRGFSLIEIIIVIAILAILIGIVVTKIAGGREASKKSRTDAQAALLYGEIVKYEIDHDDKRPEKISDLITSGYAKDADLKDGWGNYFCYEAKENNKPFALTAKGRGTGQGQDVLCYVNGKEMPDYLDGDCRAKCDGTLDEKVR